MADTGDGVGYYCVFASHNKNVRCSFDDGIAVVSTVVIDVTFIDSNGFKAGTSSEGAMADAADGVGDCYGFKTLAPTEG